MAFAGVELQGDAQGFSLSVYVQVMGQALHAPLAKADKGVEVALTELSVQDVPSELPARPRRLDPCFSRVDELVHVDGLGGAYRFQQ